MGKITFDYTAVELILGYFTEGKDNAEAIIKNPGYRHILEHSKKYSSEPITIDNLRNSLKGTNEGFDFSHVAERKEKYLDILKFLKANEREIINDYAKLCLEYLPADYEQKASIYYVIGGYNGIAFRDKICMNIDFEQFRNNFREIELYIAHELFHVGFEKYQPLPDVFKAKTFKDLKVIVLSMTMNEGLATLTPYRRRIATKELDDYDYRILLDSEEIGNKVDQYNAIITYLDENSDREFTNDILGNVLGRCSCERLFYIVGCHIGLKIESDKIKELVYLGPEKFVEYLSDR